MRNPKIIEDVQKLLSLLEAGDDDFNFADKILADIERRLSCVDNKELIMNDILDLIAVVQQDFYIKGIKVGTRICKALDVSSLVNEAEE